MARKPNYRFERMERDRNKAAKKAARAKLRAEKVEKRKAERAGLSSDGTPAEPGAQTEPGADGEQSERIAADE